MSTFKEIPGAELRDAAAEANLWSAFARSVRDNVLAELAIQCIRITAMVILARELMPRDFGVFKVLLIVSVLGILIYEAGVPDALIQRKQITRQHEATAWWISIGLAVISAALLWVGAPIFARTMKMPVLTTGIRLLCIPLLLEGSVVISNARLQRALRFSALAAADVAGEIMFLSVALAALWFGLPIWSLPLALAARLAMHAVAIWIAEPRPLLGKPSASAAHDLWRFATSVTGSQFMYLLSSNADYLLVGRLLGSGALGFYTIAWDLLRFVPDRLHQVAGRVTYPTFCRFQDDNVKLAEAYRDFFGYIARIVLPLVAVVVVVAPELVTTVYGKQWRPAAEPLRLLAAGLSLAGLRVGIGSIFYSKSHPSFDIYLHTLRLALVVFACTIFSYWGLIGVSAAMSVVEGIISVVGGQMACRLVDMKLRDLVSAAMPGVRLALVCVFGAAIGKAAARYAGFEGSLVLIAAALPPLIAYCWIEAPTLTRMLAVASGSRTREAVG